MSHQEIERDRLFVSIDEAARMLGVSTSTVRRLVRQGRLTAHQLGGPRSRLLVPLRLLERLASGSSSSTSHSAEVELLSSGGPARLPGPVPQWSRT